jgi:hypothetical protein
MSSARRLWFSGGIYEENGTFGGTLDASTFPFSFIAFLAAFFSFFACFRSPLVILDIRCGPPPAVVPPWTFGGTSQVNLWHCLWPIAPRQNASPIAQHDQPAWILLNAAAIRSHEQPSGCRAGLRSPLGRRPCRARPTRRSACRSKSCFAKKKPNSKYDDDTVPASQESLAKARSATVPS